MTKEIINLKKYSHVEQKQKRCFLEDLKIDGEKVETENFENETSRPIIIEKFE